MSPRESRPGKCALMRSTSGGISAIWILWASTMLHHDESCSIMLQRLCASDCLRSNLISRERFKSAKRYQYLCKIYCTEYTLDSVCVCGNTVIDFLFNFVLRFSVSSANIVCDVTSQPLWQCTFIIFKPLSRHVDALPMMLNFKSWSSSELTAAFWAMDMPAAQINAASWLSFGQDWPLDMCTQDSHKKTLKCCALKVWQMIDLPDGKAWSCCAIAVEVKQLMAGMIGM